MGRNGQQSKVIEGHANGDTKPILTLCESRRLASINRAPLAMGILTDKFTPNTTFSKDDVRGNAPGFGGFQDGKLNVQWLKSLDAVRERLTSGGRTLAQGASAWLRASSPKTIPIPGSQTRRQAAKNAHALDSEPLTPAQMQQIDTILQR